LCSLVHSKVVPLPPVLLHNPSSSILLSDFQLKDLVKDRIKLPLKQLVLVKMYMYFFHITFCLDLILDTTQLDSLPTWLLDRGGKQCYRILFEFLPSSCPAVLMPYWNTAIRIARVWRRANFFFVFRFQSLTAIKLLLPEGYFAHFLWLSSLYIPFISSGCLQNFRWNPSPPSPFPWLYSGGHCCGAHRLTGACQRCRWSW